MSSTIRPDATDYATPADAKTSGNQATQLFAGIAAVLVVALYMGYIFNRAMPINEGWFYYASWLMHKHQMPYRDFWFFTQPYVLFVSWLFAGDHFINLRIYGLIERIVLSGMLYFLLSRQFSAKASFLGTVVGMMVLLSYLTEGFFTYLIDSLTFLTAGFVVVYEAHAHPRREDWLLLVAGIFGSLSFFSKQTTGCFGTLAMVILIAWAPTAIPTLVRKLVYFSIGWIVAAVPFVAWLVSNGAWHAYVLEVYKGAAASKGSLTNVFFGTVARTFLPKDVAVLVAILALIGLAVWKKHLFFVKPQHNGWSRTDIAVTAVLMLAVIFVPVLFRVPEAGVNHLRQYLAVTSKVVFMAMVAQAGWLVYRRLHTRAWAGGAITAVLIIGGLLWGYGAQLSYRVEQHSIVFGMAYFLAAACDNVSSRSGKSFIGILTVLSLIDVGVIALYKYNDAYDWNGWRSTIALDYTVKSHWPQLAGFRFDGESAYMFDRILDDVAKDAKPGEPIFTFPHMPMFNFITGHPQPTFAPVHYWDVCPDYLAEADAARVKAARPAVIVDMDMPEWLWEDAEDHFRKGKRSGQRDIEALIKQFAASGDYRLQDTFIAPWVHTRINVWQRVR